MTTATTTENPPPEATESPVSDAPADSESVDETAQETAQEVAQDAGDDEGGNPNKEAAKYRRRLRETETERDELRATVESLQRQIVDDTVSRTGVPSKAFWSATELATLLDDNGTVNREAVTQTAENVRQEYSIARLPAPNPAQGSSASGPPKPSAQDEWKQAFRRR